MKISEILSEKKRENEVALDGEMEKLADAGNIGLYSLF